MSRHKRGLPVIVAPVFVNGTAVAREMAAKGAHVVMVDTSPDAVGFRSRHARERVVVPAPRRAPGAFATWLLSRRDLFGGIVIPTDDFFLREIVEHYHPLAQCYKLAVSPGSAPAVALDKELAYAAARAGGFDIPRTRRVVCPDDLEDAAREVGFPAILRPTFSISFNAKFHVKSFYLRDMRDLRQCFSRAAAAGEGVVLQEVIPGPDGNVACCKAYVAGDGEVLAPVAGFKDALYPPGFGTTQVQVARDAPEVVDLTVRILNHIDYRGALASVEWKLDPRDGKWKFLEINARSVLAIGLMKFVGADLLEMLWRDKLGLPRLPPRPIRFGRRWVYLKEGLLLYRKYPAARRRLVDYLRLYQPPLCFALLSISDVKPFLYDIAPVVARRFKRKPSSAADAPSPAAPTQADAPSLAPLPAPLDGALAGALDDAPDAAAT